MNVPIPVDQIVFREVVQAPPVISMPKFSSPIPPMESVPVSNVSMDLSSKGASLESSIPWGSILIGVTVLVVVGVILYQLEKRRSDILKEPS